MIATMKLTTLLFSVVLAMGASAFTQPQKSVIVSYPEDTPQSVLDKAMAAIKDGGGIVTHEYTLFQGFAAIVPAAVLDQVQIWGNDYQAVIEEDQVVNANAGGSTS